METTKKKKVFIDFSKLSSRELSALSEKWEHDAQMFENKLERFMQNIGFSYNKDITPETKEKIERLWKTGKSLWSRLSILESWRIKNKLKILK